MAEVIVKKGEPVDRALKRLKNKLENEGILEEISSIGYAEFSGIKH